MRTFTIFCLAILFIFSCKRKNNYDKLQMLNNIAEEVILKAQQDLIQQTALLKSAALDFKQQTDSAGLIKLQNAWEKTALAWAKNELYIFGPVLDQYLYLGMSNTPSTINTIENFINDTMHIDSIFIRNQSTKNKGLGTLEYLLYAPPTDSVLWYFTQSSEHDRRLAYLVEVSKSVHYFATEIAEAWDPQAGNYINTFNSADGTDIQSGISLIGNALISLTQRVSQKKLGKPLGKENPDNNIQIDLVETPYARYSLKLIEANLNSLKHTFNGASGEGLDDYLDNQKNGEAVQLSINEKIDNALNIVQALNSNSLQTVLNSRIDKVNELYQETRALLIIMETEMAAVLNITVLPNINDGD